VYFIKYGQEIEDQTMQKTFAERAQIEIEYAQMCLRRCTPCNEHFFSDAMKILNGLKYNEVDEDKLCRASELIQKGRAMEKSYNGRGLEPFD